MVQPVTLDMEDKSLADCFHTLIVPELYEVTVDGFEILKHVNNDVVCVLVVVLCTTYKTFIIKICRVYHHV